MRSRIVSMMVGLMVLGFISAVSGAEPNFQELMTAAKAAAQKGEVDSALEKFNSAFQAAAKPELKAEAVYARNQFLLQNKRYEEAQILLKAFALDESVPPAIRRKALVTLAGQIMWGNAEEAKQYLDQALTIPTDDVDQKVTTSLCLGYVYTIMKQPENALGVWIPVMEQKEPVHPAHLYAIAQQIGIIYQQNNDLENARKYFQLAVDNGKKVKYAFDYSEAEKALNELNKKK